MSIIVSKFVQSIGSKKAALILPPSSLPTGDPPVNCKYVLSVSNPPLSPLPLPLAAIAVSANPSVTEPAGSNTSSAYIS